MARFAIQKQFLYAVDSYEMYVFSIWRKAVCIMNRQITTSVVTNLGAICVQFM